jgi:hypothetical protein
LRLGVRVQGAEAAVIHAVVLHDCTVYATVGETETVAQAGLVKAGFKATTLVVSYTDANDTKMKLYEKSVARGEEFTVSQAASGWYGVQLVFP